MRVRPRFMLLPLTALVLGAGEACLAEPFDAGAVLFPEISAAARAQNCIRGALLAPAEVQGALTTRDCHVGPGQGYMDAYRLRVSDTLDVIIEMTSALDLLPPPPPTLDTELDLFRVDDLDDYAASKVLLSHDDDSGAGPGALLGHLLLPNTEYLIVVKGKDDLSIGEYRLRAAP